MPHSRTKMLLDLRCNSSLTNTIEQEYRCHITSNRTIKQTNNSRYLNINNSACRNIILIQINTNKINIKGLRDFQINSSNNINTQITINISKSQQDNSIDKEDLNSIVILTIG